MSNESIAKASGPSKPMTELDRIIDELASCVIGYYEANSEVSSTLDRIYREEKEDVDYSQDVVAPPDNDESFVGKMKVLLARLRDLNDKHMQNVRLLRKIV